MRKTLTLFAILLMSSGLYAQQDWKYNHYMFNGLALNPAYAGSEGNISALGIYRNMWVGMENSIAPLSVNFNIHAPIAKINSGIGMSIINDKLGADKISGVNLNYAYHQKGLFGLEGTFSAGINLGVVQRTLFGSILLPKINPDPIFVGVDQSAIAFDMGFGLFYSGSRFYAGYSNSHLTKASLQLSTGEKTDLVNHSYLTAGYKMDINSVLELRPSILVKTTYSATQVDLTGMAVYQKKYWGALAYSTQDAVIGMLGGYLTGDIDNGGLKFGVSYAFTHNQLNTIGGANSFEIMMGYNFTIKIPEKIPAYNPRFF